MVEKVLKKVTIRLTEERKKGVDHNAGKDENKVSKILFMTEYCQQKTSKMPTLKTTISGRFKKTITKREEEISKLHQLIDQSQKLLLNEQNKNQLLLSENIDEKNPGGNFGNDFF